MLRHVIFNRIPAAILVIGFCLITTSGYTFCQIRGTPMKGRDGNLTYTYIVYYNLNIIIQVLYLLKGVDKCTWQRRIF